MELDFVNCDDRSTRRPLQPTAVREICTWSASQRCPSSKADKLYKLCRRCPHSGSGALPAERLSWAENCQLETGLAGGQSDRAFIQVNICKLPMAGLNGWTDNWAQRSTLARGGRLEILAYADPLKCAYLNHKKHQTIQWQTACQLVWLWQKSLACR